MTSVMGIKIQLGSRRNTSGKPASILGKLMTTVFLSAFVAAGVFFSTMVFDNAGKAIDQQAWVEHPATIVSSGIDIDASSNEPYIPRVEYTYTHGGSDYTNSTTTTSNPATRNYREAQAYTLDYPPGGQATVYVNPDQPSESVLKIETIASLGSVAFGVLFLSLFSGIPLAIIIGTWWPRNRAKSQQGKRAHAARNRGKDKLGGIVIGVLFGGVFAVAGVGMLIFMTILPLWRTAIAQTWNQVPCVVERSELLRFEGDDGPTYRIDILYTYDFAGQTYGSNRYSFASIGSSSGHKGKQKVLNQYSVGHQTACYVDPGDPTNAVLERGLTLANLWGLFPIPFAAIGLFVIYFSLFGKDKTGNNWKPGGEKQKRQAVSEYAIGDSEDGPVTLDPTASRRKSFIGMLFFALVWNGIVGTINFFFWKDAAGDWDLMPAIFLGIFQLIGLILIGVAIRKLLVMFAPHVVLELSRQAIPLGGSADLRWRIPGTPGRVTKVTIKLIGEESATYKRGTDTVTDTETFYVQVLVGSEDGGSVPEYRSPGRVMDSGDEILAIPLETMHSFEAEHNKILWKLEVKADVPRWPDPKDTYPLTVLPMPIGGAS